MNGRAAVGGILFGYAANALGYQASWALLSAVVMVASLMGLVAASALRRATTPPDSSGSGAGSSR